MHLQALEATASAPESERIAEEEARALARTIVAHFERRGLKDGQA